MEYGEIEGLPGPEPGIVYVASMLVAARARAQGRTDVASPTSGPAMSVRDASGQIMAVRGLAVPAA